MAKENTTRELRSAGDAWTMGVQLALLLAGCTVGGWYLGRRTGRPVAWVVTGAVVGFLLSLFEVWKWCRRLGILSPPGAPPPDGRDIPKEKRGVP